MTICVVCCKLVSFSLMIHSDVTFPINVAYSNLIGIIGHIIINIIGPVIFIKTFRHFWPEVSFRKRFWFSNQVRRFDATIFWVSIGSSFINSAISSYLNGSSVPTTTERSSCWSIIFSASAPFDNSFRHSAPEFWETVSDDLGLFASFAAAAGRTPLKINRTIYNFIFYQPHLRTEFQTVLGKLSEPYFFKKPYNLLNKFSSSGLEQKFSKRIREVRDADFGIGSDFRKELISHQLFTIIL